MKALKTKASAAAQDYSSELPERKGFRLLWILQSNSPLGSSAGHIKIHEWHNLWYYKH